MTKLFVQMLMGVFRLCCLYGLGVAVVCWLANPPADARYSGALLLFGSWLQLLGLGLEARRSGPLPYSIVVMHNFAPAFTGLMLLVTGKLVFVLFYPIIIAIGLIMVFGYLNTFGYFLLPTWVGFRFGAMGLIALTSDTWVLFFCGGIAGLIGIAAYCGVIQYYLEQKASMYRIDVDYD